MTDPELAVERLPQSAGYELLSPDIDPLELASGAVQKLRDAGLPTVIPSGDLTEKTAPEAKVVDLEEFRQSRVAEPQTGTRTSATAEQSRDYQGSFNPEQQAMFDAHLEIVEPIAGGLLKSWWRHPDEYEEVISDGYLGLVNAVLNHDKDKVSPRSTNSSQYFTTSIRGEMLRGMRSRYGRVHQTIRDESGKIIKQTSKIKKVKPSVMAATPTASSLEQPVNSGEEGEEILLGEVVAPPHSAEEVVNKVAARMKIQRLLDDCDPLEREIVLLRLAGQNQREIGQTVGYSQMHVGRILKRIIGRFDAVD